MTWLVDDPSVVYLILGLAAVGFAAAWWMTKLGKYLIGLGVVVGLAVLVWLLGFLIVTDAKQIRRAIEDMAAGVEAHNLDQIFSHVSDSFRRGSSTKADFRKVVEAFISSGRAQAVTVWDFQPVEISRENGRAVMDFMVKGRGEGLAEGTFFRCRAVFVLDPDGKWRVQTFDLFQPHIDPASHQTVPLPL